MPKKFKGENSKAQEARARKSAAKAEADAAKQKAIEDEYWKDDDKHVAKKQARKVCKRYICYCTSFIVNYFFTRVHCYLLVGGPGEEATGTAGKEKGK